MTKYVRLYKLVTLLFLIMLMFSCRGDIVIYPSESEQHGDIMNGNLQGFYLLNQGNMGSNKATLDYYDFSAATYTRNIYSERNPHVPLSLGDVGNDLQIYGSRLYCVVNVSNKIEVMTADSALRIGQIDIPNCRYLCFDGQYGYATSYAGPVQTGKDHAQIGYVARFDTATLQVVSTCLVGYQPDGIAVADGKLFVANSGGYMAPDYETTISVIDLATFTEQTRIQVAPNLHHVKKDRNGLLWVSARGDEYNPMQNPSRLYAINTQTLSVVDSLDLPVTNFCIQGDSLYLFGNRFNWDRLEEETFYAIIDINTHDVLTENFLIDTDIQIKKPYGIAVNPINSDVYLTDAKDYITPGVVYCLSTDTIGNTTTYKLKWQVRTGDIPACIIFLMRFE